MAQDPPAGFTLTAPPAPRSGGGSAPPPGFTLTAPPQRRQQQAPVRNQRRPRAVAPADDNGVVEAAGVADSGGPSPSAAFLPGRYTDSQGEPMSPLEPGDQDYVPQSGEAVIDSAVVDIGGIAHASGPFGRGSTGMTMAEYEALPRNEQNRVFEAAAARAEPVAPRERLSPLLTNGELAAGAGVYRGLGGALITGQRLLGRGLDAIGLDGPGQWLVSDAEKLMAQLEDRTGGARVINPNMFGGGRLVGEIAATAPVGGLVGRGITAGGNAVARFAPGVGNAMARIGQATSAGGFLPRAAQYAETNPTVVSRAADLATRATGGAISGGVQTALIAPEDVEMGAAVGAFIPTVGAQIGRAALRPLADGYDMLTRRVGPARAARIFRESLGVDYDTAVAALQAAPEGVTARQALVEAGVEPRVFMAVGREAERGGGTPVFGAIAERQDQARRATLNAMAGGGTATEAAASRNAMRRAVGETTAPMQERALTGANASGQLDVEPIAEALMVRADTPGVRANAVQPQLMANIAQHLRNLAERGDGVIDVADLYEVRKSYVNDALDRLTGQMSLDGQKRTAAEQTSILADTRAMIDDAIEAAGGTGWRDYLQSYSTGAREAERRGLSATAAGLYDTSPNAFRRLVGGNDPETVAAAFPSGGRESFDINAMMGADYGPNRMVPLRQVAGELTRDERVGQLAADPQAVAEARALLDRSKNPAQQAFGAVARFLSPRTAAAEAFASMLAEQRIGQDVRRALAEGYQSGASALDLLAMVPTRERAQVARNMANPAFWRAVSGVGAQSGAGGAQAVREWLNRRPENANRMAIGSVGDVPSNALAQ